MKKLMMLVMAMMLVVGFTGQAMAAFENGHLIRVVYSMSGTMETATDLGSITNLTSPSTANNPFTGQNTFDLSALGTGASASNSYVTYFALVIGQVNRAWTSGPASGQITAKSAWSGFAGRANTVAQTYWNGAGGGTATQVTVATADPNSFWNQLNAGGATNGRLNGFVPAGNAAQSLAALSTPNGYVDQKLYYYSSPLGISGTSTGLNVASIRTYADGHTELNPSAVPIPAAFLLFGSGLLGLVGIRRKQAA